MAVFPRAMPDARALGCERPRAPKKLAHNYVRANAPSGQGRKRVQAGPDMVRPSTLLHLEPDFVRIRRHPARFPLASAKFSVSLLGEPGQMIIDPFVGTGTTALAAEQLGRRWLAILADRDIYVVSEDGRGCATERSASRGSMCERSRAVQARLIDIVRRGGLHKYRCRGTSVWREEGWPGIAPLINVNVAQLLRRCAAPGEEKRRRKIFLPATF